MYSVDLHGNCFDFFQCAQGWLVFIKSQPKVNNFLCEFLWIWKKLIKIYIHCNCRCHGNKPNGTFWGQWPDFGNRGPQILGCGEVLWQHTQTIHPNSVSWQCALSVAHAPSLYMLYGGNATLYTYTSSMRSSYALHVQFYVENARKERRTWLAWLPGCTLCVAVLPDDKMAIQQHNNLLEQ